MDRLRAMEVFRAVLDHGSFARAARRLGMSPASASRLVAELEDDLGTRLLHRTTRSLSATEEGRAYYERCAAILDQIDETERSLREARAVPAGTLRVTASPAFGALALWPILPEFLAAHPRVRIELSLEDRVVDLVREGFDVALRFVTSERRDATLIARRVRRYRELFVASPEYLREHGTPCAPADLANHATIVWWSPTHLPSFTFGGERIDLRGPIRTDSTFVQRSAALAGLGIGMIPEYVVADDLAAGRLVRVLPDHELPGHDLWALYPKAGALTARVRAFVDHVAARL